MLEVWVDYEVRWKEEDKSRMATAMVAKRDTYDSALQKAKQIIREGLMLDYRDKPGKEIELIPSHRIWKVRIKPAPKEALL